MPTTNKQRLIIIQIQENFDIKHNYGSKQLLNENVGEPHHFFS